MSTEVEVAPEDDFLTSPLGSVAFRAAGTLGLSVEAAVYPIAIIMKEGGRQRERDRQTDRQTDRDRDRQRQREMGSGKRRWRER